MRVIIHPDYCNLTDFINQLPATFDQHGELLYQGRNTVKRYDVDGLQVVVKRYKHPNIYQRIAYTFFKSSKTERAYKYAALLRSMGVDSPHEVAYIEANRHGLFTTGFFISLNCDYPPTSIPLSTDDFDRPLADALARFLVELHEKGILHGDLNLTNILYHTDESGQYQFTLIDTNRTVFKRPTPDECLDNMKRLTHKRDLLFYIISLYARLRGWDADECIQKEIYHLERFEKKERLKFKLQDFFGIHHPRRS